MDILPAFKKVKTFVFDMDGVLTDGGLLVDDDGKWLRRMDIKDGYALQLAIKKGYNIIVISGSTSKPVSERLQRLGVTEIFMGISDKEMFLKNYILEKNLLQNEILYMGDDVPDYACMTIAGISCCPADAVSDIKKVSNYISHVRGGNGCVRDVIEKVLKLNDHWPLQAGIASI